jgi:large subunit ribosomal protein L13
MKTYQPKAKEVKRSWRLLDAKGKILGRLATEAAVFLMGKDKATFSKHIDMGDNVVILNAEKIVTTGKKALQKIYRSHSGYPGGLKEESFAKVMATHPERILERAVSGMLPDNRLKAPRMARLKVVAGEANPYEDKFKD